ncbi:MAG TPA: hypothetical protein VFE37_19620 [Chloroflexota bacterium]|nr:hypothetical protein [Chloroflexota bacterium]
MKTTDTLTVKKLSPEQLRRALSEREEQYKMSSRLFYDRFRAGELGDEPAYVAWAGLCYMAVRNGLLPVDPASGR